MMFGNIGDTKETLQKSVEFLLEYDDHTQLRTVRPVTPYPGSPLYYYAIEKGLLKGPEDFYEKKHINSDLLSINFTNMSNEEIHGLLLAANTLLVERYFDVKRKQNAEMIKKLYNELDASFRGFRQS
jgi:hypothetical protein